MAPIMRTLGRLCVATGSPGSTLAPSGTAATSHERPEFADDFRQGGRGEKLLRSGASHEDADIDREPSRGGPRGATGGSLDRTVDEKPAAHGCGGRNPRTGPARYGNQRRR